MGNNHGSEGNLLLGAIAIILMVAIIKVALHVIFLGVLIFGVSSIFAMFAWKYKTTYEKNIVFLILLVIGLASCIGISLYLNSNKPLVDYDIVLIIILYFSGIFFGYKKGVSYGMFDLNNKLKENVLRNETYIKAMNNYKEARDKFNNLGGQLIKSSDYYEHIRYFEHFVDMRCFDDVLVLMRNYDLIYEIEQNLTGDENRKWITRMYKNFFNKEITIDNSNVIEAYVEIINTITQDIYLECEVSKIVYYKFFEDNNNSHIEILLNDDSIIDLPGCYYQALKSNYPNLDNRNLY